MNGFKFMKISEFRSTYTTKLFNWRCTYLQLQFTVYCGLTFVGMFGFFVVVYYVPTLSPLLNSIIRTQNMALELIMDIVEAYVFVVGIGFVLTGNIAVCITFGSVTNGIQSLNGILKNECSNTKYLAANRAYVCYQVITDRLTSVFSVSLLFQELSFLLVIVTLIVGGVKMAQLRLVSLKFFCYGTSSEIALAVIFQFLPMIKLHLYSQETSSLMRALARKDRHAKSMARRSRVLKIRPMGVHTITLNTLFDYAVFTVSLLLMLLKA